MQGDLKVPFYLLARKARRDAGLSQTDLAGRVGCKQSQISSFEAGVFGKVSRETILRIAETLGIEAPPEAPNRELEAGAPALAAPPQATLFHSEAVSLPFCPDFRCLSNLPYFVGEQLLFLPLGSCGTGARCAICGELLERRCLSCGAPVRSRGGCCGTCGRPLLELPEGLSGDPSQWAEAQRAAVTAFAASLQHAALPQLPASPWLAQGPAIAGQFAPAWR